MSYYGGDGEIFSNAYGGEAVPTVVLRVVAGGALVVLLLISIIYISISMGKTSAGSIDFKAATASISIILPITLGAFLTADYFLAGGFRHSAIGRIAGLD